MRNVGLALHKSDITWENIVILAGLFDRKDLINPCSCSDCFGRASSSFSPTDAVPGKGGNNANQQSGVRHGQGESVLGSSHTTQRHRSGASASPVKTCIYCGRVGHVKSECRRLNRLCYGCGSSDHLIGQCPSPPSASGRQPNVLSEKKCVPGSDSTAGDSLSAVDSHKPVKSAHFSNMSRPPPLHSSNYF